MYRLGCNNMRGLGGVVNAWQTPPLSSFIVVEPPPPALQASFKKYSVSTSGVVQGLSPGIVMVPTPANSPQLQYSRRMA